MILFKTDITAFNLGNYEAHTITVNCENSGQKFRKFGSMKEREMNRDVEEIPDTENQEVVSRQIGNSWTRRLRLQKAKLSQAQVMKIKEYALS